MHLTKYEKETIILGNEADDFWDVFTYNRPLKRRLAEYAAKYPDQCKLIKRNDEGGVTYWIKKARLSLRLTAPYSEKRRKASEERAKELYHQERL